MLSSHSTSLSYDHHVMRLILNRENYGDMAIKQRLLPCYEGCEVEFIFELIANMLLSTSTADLKLKIAGLIIDILAVPGST